MNTTKSEKIIWTNFFNL